MHQHDSTRISATLLGCLAKYRCCRIPLWPVIFTALPVGLVARTVLTPPAEDSQTAAHMYMLAQLAEEWEALSFGDREGASS